MGFSFTRITLCPHAGPQFVAAPAPAESGDVLVVHCEHGAHEPVILQLPFSSIVVAPGRYADFTCERRLYSTLLEFFGARPRLKWRRIHV